MNFSFGPALFSGNPTHWKPVVKVLQKADLEFFREQGSYVPEIFKGGAQFHVMVEAKTMSGTMHFKLYSNN